jgi:hypothetical protein
MRIPFLLLLPCLVLSCGRDPLEADTSTSGLNATAAPSEEVTVVDPPADEKTPDTVVAKPDAAPPNMPSLTPDGTSGPDACLLFGAKDQGVFNFESASWQYQVKDCQSSACWDFFSIDISCRLSFQHDNKMKTASAPPDLCRAAARLFTSPRFEAATKACPIINQPINESFEVSGAVNVRRKFSFCNTAEMEQARACLRWVVDSTLGPTP